MYFCVFTAGLRGGNRLEYLAARYVSFVQKSKLCVICNKNYV